MIFLINFKLYTFELEIWMLRKTCYTQIYVIPRDHSPISIQPRCHGLVSFILSNIHPLDELFSL